MKLVREVIMDRERISIFPDTCELICAVIPHPGADNKVCSTLGAFILFFISAVEIMFEIHTETSGAALLCIWGVAWVVVVVLFDAHAPPLILRDKTKLQDRKESNFLRVFLELV